MTIRGQMVQHATRYLEIYERQLINFGSVTRFNQLNRSCSATFGVSCRTQTKTQLIFFYYIGSIILVFFFWYNYKFFIFYNQSPLTAGSLPLSTADNRFSKSVREVNIYVAQTDVPTAPQIAELAQAAFKDFVKFL